MENNYQDLLNITAGIVETARRNAGMTQKELANSLGVIQSTISRIEKGILSPTLFHWMEMCNILKIPQDAISVGYLDHATITKIKSDVKEGGHNLPKRYRDLRCIKIRQILPIINFVREELGDQTYLKVIKEMGMRPTFFINLDNQVNFAFLNDLLEFIGHFQKVNKIASKSILKYAAEGSSHGVLSIFYNNSSNQIDLMERYFKNSTKYQRAFNIEVKEVKDNLITLRANTLDEIRPTLLSIGIDMENLLWSFYETYLKKFSLYDYKNRIGTAREIQVQSTERDSDFGRDIILTVA